MKSKKVYIQQLVVEGAGEFPWDMLRYDSCWPADERESPKLQTHRTEKRSVELTRMTRNTRGPNERRWKSFGWTVVSWKEDDRP